VLSQSLSLAISSSSVKKLAREIGAQGRNRTTDTVIFSHVLYQLSYLGGWRRGDAAGL
jgi:hypothetical protein